ncbi:DUF7064 domain-containing protein [Nakamurella alba]|uniref:DUF7064 domain-containing protein n=1 Tax=Nakamurella alba TaxID=2665158 RepID=UPI001E37B6FA|nr:hypothetical protein [Nakamurella alba]
MLQLEDTFHDPLVAPGTPDLPERFFDRFMFNLHPTDATAPSVIMGAGVYPVRDVTDGFAVVTTATEQRNLRFSTELSALSPAAAGSVGPLSWTVLEPNRSWRLRLADNPIGLGCDITWRARTEAWHGGVEVRNADGVPSTFDHLFQSGTYTGTITIDGVRTDVAGWYGQRDRSRGVRTMAGGQGLHLWYQAQFPEYCVGFLHVEDRTGGRLLLEGAVLHTSGEVDDIVDVRHDLTFGPGLDLETGRVRVTTASGAVLDIDGDARAGGGWMAGAGYGGHHGKPCGVDHLEYDVYPLDGSVSPATVDSALTDRLTAFTCDGVAGTGILEFAHSRSRSYTYRPSLV